MAARSKRLTRPPAKRRDADDAMFDEAEVQRALRASVKLQKRTSSTCMPSCPTFHPTPEQFRDPFAYIKSITSEGIAAGIVKIVPPEGATRARGRVVVVVDDDDYDDDDARSFRFGVERRSPSLHPVRSPVPRACADGARPVRTMTLTSIMSLTQDGDRRSTQTRAAARSHSTRNSKRCTAFKRELTSRTGNGTRARVFAPWRTHSRQRGCTRTCR